MSKKKYPDGLRRCYDCKDIKKIEEFSRNRQKYLGRGYICKYCKNIKSAEWRRLNGIVSGDYDYKQVKLRWDILLRDNFTCQYCGRRPPEVSLEIDHIFPVSKGGKTKYDNLTTACKDCNRGKRDSLV